MATDGGAVCAVEWNPCDDSCLLFSDVTGRLRHHANVFDELASGGKQMSEHVSFGWFRCCSTAVSWFVFFMKSLYFIASSYASVAEFQKSNKGLKRGKVMVKGN